MKSKRCWISACLQEALDAAAVHDVGEVDRGAGQGRAGDAADGGDVGWIQRSAVHGDAGA
ncbi:MAG TPA: hypothetical protein VNR66_02965 [Solirubrobacteraceae bacterium]|nr:hypothetical protein [Solirubrobacteraceae bacterium]